MTWTLERDALLRKLLASEEMLSARQIGEQLGVSRNAVISRVKRSGLKLANAQGKHNVPRRPSQTRRPRAPNNFAGIHTSRRMQAPNGPEIIELPSEIASDPVRLFDLEPHHCRWPVSGDGIETLFCAAGAADGSSYCVRHDALSRGKSHSMTTLGRQIRSAATRKERFPNVITLSDDLVAAE